ncbi:MAG TPA: hypothetical protein PL182_11480 [Pseudobdellovibrionaceae bacterium]|nr:hypothetical protein [Pseudobdellovibrionaceae bacterium]
MDVLKRLLPLVLAVGILSGCQITYVMKSAKSHLSILWSRVPVDEALKDPG